MNEAVLGRNNSQRALRNIGQTVMINVVYGMSSSQIDNMGHLGVRFDCCTLIDAVSSAQTEMPDLSGRKERTSAGSSNLELWSAAYRNLSCVPRDRCDIPRADSSLWQRASQLAPSGVFFSRVSCLPHNPATPHPFLPGSFRRFTCLDSSVPCDSCVFRCTLICFPHARLVDAGIPWRCSGDVSHRPTLEKVRCCEIGMVYCRLF